MLIERLTKEEYPVDDLSDLPTLIESIRLQRSTGATEAARAIRKKLSVIRILEFIVSLLMPYSRKYGNPHRQLRALTILDDLIQNAGTGFQKQFADEMLLERLRFMVTDQMTDSEVKAKCNALYRQWAVAYKDTPGMHNIAVLYKQLPQRKKAPSKEHSKVLRETERPDDEDEEDEPYQRRASGSASHTAVAEKRRSSTAEFHAAASQLAFAPAYHQPTRGGSSFQQPSSPTKKKKDKKGNKAKVKPFNFEKEKPQINQVITLASIEATGLLNAMKLINREKERVSDNTNCKKRFETCKQLRRQTFRYCSIVMDESYLGTLLNANDQLSDALILFEQLDRSFDYDSDSEDFDDADGPPARARVPSSPTTQQQFAGLSLGDQGPAMPPRPTPSNPVFVTSPPDHGKGKARQDDDEGEEDVDEDDEDDPFADRNAVNTPRIEKEGMAW